MFLTRQVCKCLCFVPYQARRRVNFAKVLSKLQNRRDSMFTLNFNFGCVGPWFYKGAPTVA